MRIYFVGSHSTGKTTLARWASKTYRIPMISEVARAVLAEMEASLASLRTDMELVNRYQKEVLRRQIEAERAAGSEYVSDRAFDSLAYTADHSLITADVMESGDLREYMKTVAQGVVFFVRPHRSLLKEDGTRESPVWDGVIRIDGMIKFLLEQFRIPYCGLDSASMQERVRTVSMVVGLLRRPDPTLPGSSPR